MDITYVTGNSYKVELAKRILEPHGVNVLQKKFTALKYKMMI